MLTHTGTQTIKTERLTLRRFTVDDAQAMYQNWASDAEVTRFLTWKPHESVEVSRKILEEWVPNYSNKDYYHWAIVPDNIGMPMGSIAAVEHYDEIETVHIGYALSRQLWHRGYMSESLAAVIKFFFTQVGVNRVESRHDPDNPHSGDVMKKCGMTYEGTRRQGDVNNRGIVDACYYSILKSEFTALFYS